MRVPDADQDHVAGDSASLLAEEFAVVAQTLFSAGSEPETLDALVNLAVDTIEGCDFAGIFIVADGVITTPVSTASAVVEIDRLQHSTGEGPCLDALAADTPFYASDLTESAQWPTFGPEAAAMGVRSMLAMPLATEGAVGALNLYARYPLAFGVIDRARGLLLARLAGLAIAAARTHEAEESLTQNLHAALKTREVIGQAQGILMERERITGDQAFDILRQASQRLNRKLREVAQTLIDTGERPETGPPRSGS